jgi:hypothetical protein
MTRRRTAKERIAKRSAKAQPSDYGVGASAISIASAGISAEIVGCSGMAEAVLAGVASVAIKDDPDMARNRV